MVAATMMTLHTAMAAMPWVESRLPGGPESVASLRDVELAGEEVVALVDAGVPSVATTTGVVVCCMLSVVDVGKVVSVVDAVWLASRGQTLHWYVVGGHDGSTRP